MAFTTRKMRHAVPFMLFSRWLYEALWILNGTSSSSTSACTVKKHDMNAARLLTIDLPLPHGGVGQAHILCHVSICLVPRESCTLLYRAKPMLDDNLCATLLMLGHAFLISLGWNACVGPEYRYSVK